MLPIIIPLIETKDNIELRYTLRSIEKYYGSTEIFLVGDCPRWIKNIHHIPFKQDPIQCRNKNVMQKLLLASNTINSDFIRWSDDIFALGPVSNIPTYSQGTMMEASLRCGFLKAKFRLSVNNTMKEVGINAPFFDVHTPCPIFHESYKEFCLKSSWSGYNTHVLRSYYYNFIKSIPEPFSDLKLFKERSVSELTDLCKERLYVSVGDDLVHGSLRVWLDELFPDKSMWEK